MQDNLKEKLDKTIAEAEIVEKEENEKIEKIKKETLLDDYKAEYFIKKCVYIYKTYKKENIGKELNLASLCYIHNFASSIDITTAEENKEKIEAFRNYIKELDLIEQELTLEELEETINYYNEALIFTNEELYKTLALTFYLIKKYRGTPKATKIIELLRSYKDGKIEVIKDTSFKSKEEELETLTGNYIIANIRATLYNFLLNNIDSEYKELAKKIEKDHLEDTYTEAEEIAKDLEITTETILNNYEAINIIRIKLNGIVEEPIEPLLDNEEVNNILNDAKEKLGEIGAIELLTQIRTNIDLDIYSLLYSAFSNDPIIKEEVKDLLGLEEKKITKDKDKQFKETYIKDLKGNITLEQPKKETNLKEEIITITKEELEKPLSEELKKELIELAENNPNKWNFYKVNNTKISQNINNAVKKLFSYEEPRKKAIETQIKTIKGNRSAEELTEEELIQVKELEEDLEQDEEIKRTIKSQLQQLEDQKELLRIKIEQADTYKEKQLLNKQLKSVVKKEKKKKQELESEEKTNLFIQTELELETNKTIISATDEGIKAYINAESPILYSKENTRLRNFIENKYYNTFEEKRNGVITFTLKEYAEENGIKPYSSLKENIEKSLNNIYKLGFEVINKDLYKGYIDTLRFREASEIGTRKYITNDTGEEVATKEDIFYIQLTPTKERILTKNKGSFVASIPKALNTLGAEKNEGLSYELGNNIYRDLRNDLKNQAETGYFSLKQKIKYFMQPLEETGLISVDAKPVRKIEPLRKAFNDLIDLGLIELTKDEETNPFIYYDNAQKKKGIEKDFKERNIIIIFRVADYETYRKIIAEYKKHHKKRTTKN